MNCQNCFNRNTKDCGYEKYGKNGAPYAECPRHCSWQVVLLRLSVWSTISALVCIMVISMINN